MPLKTLLAVAATGAATLLPAQSALAVDPQKLVNPVEGTVNSTIYGATTATQQVAAGQTDAATQTVVGTALSNALGLPLGVALSVGPALGPAPE